MKKNEYNILYASFQKVKTSKCLCFCFFNKFRNMLFAHCTNYSKKENSDSIRISDSIV